MKNKELLRLALTLGLSCNLLGLNTYAIEGNSCPSTTAVSSKDSGKIDTFFSALVSLLVESVLEEPWTVKILEDGSRRIYYHLYTNMDKDFEIYKIGWVVKNDANIKQNAFEFLMNTVKNSLKLLKKRDLQLQFKGRPVISLPKNDLIFISEWEKEGNLEEKIKNCVRFYVPHVEKRFKEFF